MNAAIVLNWNAGEDTVSCLNSLIKNCLSIDLFVVVDNCSNNDSVHIIRHWYDSQPVALKIKIKLLENDINSGYAGGNNYAIAWCLRNLSVENFWIVNNDIYVDDDAFKPMLKILEKNKKAVVGSVIVKAGTLNIECYGGGVIFPILGKAKLFEKNTPISCVSHIKGNPDYVMGCSMAFSKLFVDDVGIMDERYFMYSEEIDWQKRGQNKGFSIEISKESFVYHQGSMSSGGKGSFYHYYRNRAAILFNRKFYGLGFSVVSCFCLILVTTLLEFRNPGNVIAGIKGAFSGLVNK